MGKLVKKKLEKGKLIEQIADELEEDINVIQKTAEELMKETKRISRSNPKTSGDPPFAHGKYYSVC